MKDIFYIMIVASIQLCDVHGFLDWVSVMINSSHEHNLFQFYPMDAEHIPNNKTMHNYRQNIPVDVNFAYYNHLLITKANHNWCSLYRDNWSCIGKQYKKVLRTTPLFNTDFTMEKIHHGTHIFAEGNSYFAEILYSWFCETSAYYLNPVTNNTTNFVHNNIHNTFSIKIWKIDHNANSMFVYIPEKDISLFLLDNDKVWNLDTKKTVKALKLLGYEPSIIVLGQLNDELKYVVSPLRYSLYAESFNTASIIIHHSKLLLGCMAEFQDCIDSRYGHQCVPGPILRYTEEFARLIIFYSFLDSHSLPSYLEDIYNIYNNISNIESKFTST